MAERRLHYKIRGEVGRKRSWAAVAKHRMMEIRNILVEVEDREKNALESANKAMHTLRGPAPFLPTIRNAETNLQSVINDGVSILRHRERVIANLRKEKNEKRRGRYLEPPKIIETNCIERIAFFQKKLDEIRDLKREKGIIG